VPQTFGWLAPQVWPGGQAPHSSVPQHPSLTWPQSAPSWAQVCGEQSPAPHTLGIEAPHWKRKQVDQQKPHSRMLPQPSPMGPQLAPAWAQVIGTQGPGPVPVEPLDGPSSSGHTPAQLACRHAASLAAA
jgi:hypothetical protein